MDVIPFRDRGHVQNSDDSPVPLGQSNERSLAQRYRYQLSPMYIVSYRSKNMMDPRLFSSLNKRCQTNDED